MSSSLGDSNRPPVYEIEIRQVLTYQLSCGVCKLESDLQYVGSTEQGLKVAMRGHVDSLCEIIQRNREAGNSDAYANGIDAESSDFGNSSLGMHILDEHCRDIKKREDVMTWWKENVAVRVKMHKYEKRRDTDGTFDYSKKEEKPEFVQQKQQKEEDWEEKKKIQEHQYKQKLLESNALQKEDCFDVIWQQRYDELKEYANENDGSTSVPRSYKSSPLLGKWVENQRLGYRRKHNIRPKLELEAEGSSRMALTDRKEMLLKDIGFVWFDAPKQRWDERGIAVMYGQL